MPFVHVVMAVIMATQFQTVTITGPITGTPTFLNWTPAAEASFADDHPLPLPTLDITAWLGIAWYWIKNHWLDDRFFGYWIIYQVAVIALGDVIGMILQKGGFGRLMGRTLASIESRVSKEPAPEEEEPAKEPAPGPEYEI
jgi:hypothetical protein